MHQFAISADDARTRGRAFVRRIYLLRMLGVSLLALPYASVMHELGAGAMVWCAMAFNVLVWPHLAWWLASRSPHPVRTEMRSLALEAGFGGFWVAVSQFSLLPAAVMVTIFMSDRLSAGGVRLLVKALCAFAVGVLVFGWLFGFHFTPLASLRTTLCALPALLLYMLAFGMVTYRLARRIAEQNRELHRLNHTDPGLDLPNRRFFNLHAGKLIARTREEGGEAVLLLMDVDRFKTINDRYGHGVGDAVLRAVAQVLCGHAGDGGFPARIGGDEFALLLPLGQGEGERALVRLRKAVAALDVEGCGLRIDISVGMAALQDHHRGLDDWMSAADRAMYVAKASAQAQRPTTQTAEHAG